MFEQFFVWYGGLSDSLWGALFLFVIGVVLLIKGGDWFVDGAVGKYCWCNFMARFSRGY